MVPICLVVVVWRPDWTLVKVEVVVREQRGKGALPYKGIEMRLMSYQG